MNNISHLHKTLYFQSSFTYIISFQPHKNPVRCMWPIPEIRCDKGQVFMDRKPPPPDCKLNRKDNTYKCTAKRKRLHHTTKTHSNPPHPLSLTAHLRMLRASPDSVKADKAPSPNPISCAS